jgi:hypothetical protein
MKRAVSGALYALALAAVSSPAWLSPGTAKTVAGIEHPAVVPRIAIGSLRVAPRLPITLPAAPVLPTNPTSPGTGGTSAPAHLASPSGVTTQQPKRILDFEQ